MNAKIDKLHTKNWYRLGSGTGTGAGTPIAVPVPAEIEVAAHLYTCRRFSVGHSIGSGLPNLILGPVGIFPASIVTWSSEKLRLREA